jgi:hypothetical protein
MEEHLPLILDDFELDDRVYRQNESSGEVVFGTVVGFFTDSLGITEYLQVEMDGKAKDEAGAVLVVALDLFQVDSNGHHNYVQWWAKGLNLAEVAPGSRLSYLSDYEEGIQVRNYAEVLTYVPHEYMVVSRESVGLRNRKYTYWERPGKSLESELRHFELEG